MNHRAAALLLTVITVAGVTAEETYEPPRARSGECLPCHEAATSHGNHPAGVDYAERQLGSHTLRPTNAPSRFYSTVGNDLLVEGRVECSSCHMTHEQVTVMPFRLRTRNAEEEGALDYRSEYIALCTSCHELD